MVRKWRDRVRNLVRGSIEGAPRDVLIRSLQSTDSSRRARTYRELAARGHAEIAPLCRSGLGDQVPGVRRAAAWAWGWTGEPSGADALLAAAAAESCDAPRWTMGVAAVRCGAGVSGVWKTLADAARRVLHTHSGPRAPAPLAGAGVSDLDLLWTAALSPGSADPDALIPVDHLAAWQGARARVQADPDDRQTLLDLAVFEHPEDLELLLAATRSQGRRMRHTAAAALGFNGDPRGSDALLEVLHAIDVDPGHGFAGRATASMALGRLGLPQAGRALTRAMRDEALDHEGRPGAGLGIQRPVRAAMITALGEIGGVEWGELVAGYLGNTTGTAHGGYYLPAMDALVKLGAESAACALLGADEVVAANALGVLGALGRMDVAEAHTADHRLAVAAVAAAVLGIA